MLRIHHEKVRRSPPGPDARNMAQRDNGGDFGVTAERNTSTTLR
jgi:hypothetical protein